MFQTAELLEEAAEARALATQVNDPASIRDLLRYADALEQEAERLSVPPAPERSKAQSNLRANLREKRYVTEPSREIRQPYRSPRKMPCAG
jgi:hypothetical protein